MEEVEAKQEIEIMNDLRQTIKMHNNLASGKNPLEAMEQKMFLYAISLIDNESDEFYKVEFRVSDLIKATGMSSNNVYKKIDNSTDIMMGVFMRADLGDKKWVKRAVMQECSYDNGLVKFIFHPHMKEYLLGLQEHYCKLPLKYTLKIKNAYVSKIYILLKANEYLFKKRLWKIEYIDFQLQEFREIIGLKNGKYKAFKDFNLNILERSYEEINGNTDIEFEYQKLTKGNSNKVIGIRFIIKPGEDKPKYAHLPMFAKIIEKIKLNIENIGKTDLTNDQIYELYTDTSKKFEKRNKPNDKIYVYMNKYLENSIKNKPENLYSYYKKGLTDDYIGLLDML